ncbi:MAG: helix-turn-helix domain-containing protein [Verrucomicrobiota bacterium]|jgi:excisionase family DNA binding protein
MQKKDLGQNAPRLSYKLGEAADLTGLSQASIRRAIKRGLLKPCRVFRHVLIPADQLRDLINRN